MKKVRKNILVILILAVLIISMFPVNILATTLNIEVMTDIDIYNVGETVRTRIRWDSGMQAAEFTLEFDSSKLSLIESTIEEDYYNVQNNEIVVSKISLDDTNFSEVQFTFEAIDNGEVNIALKEVECFADGNLISPDTIDYKTKGSKTIEIRRFGDLNLDGVVDSADVEQLSNKLELGSAAVWNEMEWINADVNMDNWVDSHDLEVLFAVVDGDVVLPVRLGDIDLDKIVTSEDWWALHAYLNENASVKCSAYNMDVNLDGEINDDDLVFILCAYRGYIDLPVRISLDSNLKTGYLKGERILYGLEEDMSISEFDIKINYAYSNKIIDRFGEIISEWDSASGTGSSHDSTVGTGVKTNIIFANEPDNIDAHCELTYNTVLFGDTTGDGKINAIDALALIKDINGKISFESEIYRHAGRIVTKTELEAPTSVDALAIIKHANGKYLIDQTFNRLY